VSCKAVLCISFLAPSPRFVSASRCVSSAGRDVQCLSPGGVHLSAREEPEWVRASGAGERADPHFPQPQQQWSQWECAPDLGDLAQMNVSCCFR